MPSLHALLILCLTSWTPVAPPDGRVTLGRLDTGATVVFVQAPSGDWGLEVAGGPAPRVAQPTPVRLTLRTGTGAVRQVMAGYTSVRAVGGGVDAFADLAGSSGGGAAFHVVDRWRVQGAILSLDRQVTVTGSEDGGFATAFDFGLDPSVGWSDVNFLAPGLLYGDPAHNGDRTPGGTLNNEARRFVIREDYLPAPLFALVFANGASIAALDPAPTGETTFEESKLTRDVMTDARFQFGSIGAFQPKNGPVQFGFEFPGSMRAWTGGRGAPPTERWFHRYHPISPGTAHAYRVDFRFGAGETFRDVTRHTWRWAWSNLKPAVTPIDVEQMRVVLTDHMAAQAATIDGRTAIPFVASTVTDTLQWNWTMVAMGFVGKNLECADQLLREGDRDTSARGRMMRETGLAIIASMIRALPTVPLQATGYDLSTGKPHDHRWLAPWLRNASEDMRALVRAYRRERAHGVDHPEWIAWVRTYVDWLVQQQREDGSFPRRWKPGSNDVEEPSGTTSYSPVPLLVLMAQHTGDTRYLRSAERAAAFVWTMWGQRGHYVGGASDNPDATDKEAGMLSLEAFLSLYEATKDRTWLDRARAAADFAETWMWIWNLPMPVDADDSQLHWKKGVSTVGVQGITAMAAGGADEYLDWSAPSYARLYRHTQDSHYLDVARLLLHNTKSMVALPGRQYDLKGIGWQQEGWRMGPGGGGRGVGGHRFWLPWISANHLYSITGLEEYEPELFEQLSAAGARAKR